MQRAVSYEAWEINEIGEDALALVAGGAGKADYVNGLVDRI